MKTIISLFYVFLLLLGFQYFGYSQDESFHQVIFGKVDFESYEYWDFLPKNIFTFDLNAKKNNTLTISADFQMSYIWIYNESGFDFFNQIDSNIFTILLPSGYYHIFTGYAPQINHHTIIIKDNVDVTRNCEIKLLYEEAIFTNLYTFKKISSDTLNISSIFLHFFNQIIPQNLRISHLNINSDYFLIKFNSFPDHFKGEWAVKGKPFYNNNDLYLLNNPLIFHETDTTITNDINNFAVADIEYFLPDSILPAYQKNIFTFIPDIQAWGLGNITYTYPLSQRIYQDTTSDQFLRSSKFWQSINVSQIGIDRFHYINTSDIRIGTKQVNGFHWRNSKAPQFIISDTNIVHIGLNPTFWFGKFVNMEDTIKIRSSYGRWEYLFLSQTNDLLKHYPIDYQIISDSTLIMSGEFNLLFGEAGLRFGFDTTQSTFSVQSGKYNMIITDNFSEVAGYSGYSKVKANFDLMKADKNPPNIVSFQIISGKEVTHKFYNNINNKIRFIVEDNVQVDSTALYYSYKNDSIKYKIPLTFNEPYFEGIIPNLSPGYYNLHTFIQDNSQNYIECNMVPAFMVDTSVLSIQKSEIIASCFQLFQNYPNPFNSFTSIPFSIPKSFNKNIKIDIYNILGKHIITLFNKKAKQLFNIITWDGYNKNRKNMPSGIYFIRMKGGDYLATNKVLLIK